MMQNAAQPEVNPTTLTPAQKLAWLDELAQRIHGDIRMVPVAEGKPNFNISLDDLLCVPLVDGDLEEPSDVERLCIARRGFDQYTLDKRDADAAFLTRLDFDTGNVTHAQIAGDPESEERCRAALQRGVDNNDMWFAPYSSQDPEPAIFETIRQISGLGKKPANDNLAPSRPGTRSLAVAPSMCPNPLSPEAAGGLLSDIATWITSTAIVPVPELSMVSAIALVAGMFGNRLLGPTQSGLNLYLTTLMDTAGGKGHPPKAIRKLAELSGKPGAATNGDHTSYAALERTLRRNPSTVITMDEFGITLQDVNSRHTSSPAASIRKFLLAVYDQANSTFDGRIYASSEAKKDDSPIVGPALTVLGMTTPETLFAGLSEASITDGFINRFIFVTGSSPTTIRAPRLLREDHVPKPLIVALKEAQSVIPLSGGLAGKYTVPFGGGEDGDAYARWADVFMWQYQQAWTSTERNINGRAAENAIRLATIRAVSRNAVKPSVTVDDVEWGWGIVHSSIALVTSGAEKHMAASPAEALRKAIIAALEEAPAKTLAFSKLMERRGVRGAEHYELDGALKWLVDAERIRDASGRKTPGKGSKFVLTE